MRLKPKHKRLLAIVVTLAIVAVAVACILSALKSNIMFFYTPTDLKEQAFNKDRSFRLGGMVKDKTVRHTGDVITFVVTDYKNELVVTYQGLLPSLFREGQGVVADGKMGADGVFHAARILAKHDEKYMPPNVQKVLDKNEK